jgi:hypothetical protein
MAEVTGVTDIGSCSNSYVWNGGRSLRAATAAAGAGVCTGSAPAQHYNCAASASAILAQQATLCVIRVIKKDDE